MPRIRSACRITLSSTPTCPAGTSQHLSSPLSTLLNRTSRIMAEVVARGISINQTPGTHSLTTTLLLHKILDEDGAQETHIAQPLRSALLSRVGRVLVGPGGKGTSLSRGPSGLLLQPTSHVSGATAITETMGSTGLRDDNGAANEPPLPEVTRPGPGGLPLLPGDPQRPSNRFPSQWTTRP